MSAESTAAAAPASAAGKASKKQQKKDEKKTKKNESAEFDYTTLPASTIKLFLADDSVANLKVALIAALCSAEFVPISAKNPYFPVRPSLLHNNTQLFGANTAVRYLLAQNSSFSGSFVDASVDDVLNYEQYSLAPAVASGDVTALQAALSTLEAHPAVATSTVLHLVLYSSLSYISKQAQHAAWFTASTYPLLHQVLNAVQGQQAELVTKAQQSLLVSTDGAKASNNDSATSGASALPPVTPAELDSSIDWAAAGLMSSLKRLFTSAIIAAFPESVSLSLQQANIARCANSKHGDFQCNNALTLAKALKPLAQYAALSQPRLVAERIVAALPQPNPVILSAVAAPNGFINVTLQPSLFTQSIADKVQTGRVAPPQMPTKKVLVDFSSPNIAKEMHVGHLRSTIIGDSICRILEYTQHDVLRVNHVGDWGTQFGMLITYLQQQRPDFLNEKEEDAADISYLTRIYKESKKRFDEDPVFKETARLNVVKLQSGDEACRAIWLKLCDISRREFQKVYDILGVHLTETGESFYNPLIPSVIEELRQLGLVTQDQGMEIVMLPHFTIPLIVRKSDGGYGYDSTDMAALKHRLFTLQRDWIIIITDAGQATHFEMCFDAARAANWITHQRLDHIGFGVVCGDDGKRFKTRSSETVKLIDLLTTARQRMQESLTQRMEQQQELSAQAAAQESNAEGAALAQKKVKNVLSAQEIDSAAAKLGYGAVKYFDLKQHPQTNYIFNYDHMLNTKGDTAVYLMFAYARLVSILRKAEEEKGISLSAFKHEALNLVSLDAPEERALAFELLNFGDVIQYVLQELLPNRLCDYLKEVCVKFTDFVTHCQVLPSASATSSNDAALRTTQSRLLLCEATRLVLSQCFDLLGIEPCDRI